LLAAAVVFAGYFAVGAIAAPSVTPWPDLPGSGHQAVVQQGEHFDATETPEIETPGPTQTPDEVDEANTPEDNQEVDAEATDQPAEATPGVPLDSPACAGDEQHPNPHDTDGDSDGCRVVQTDHGPKNLPDPAADAQEGNTGNIGNHSDDGIDSEDGNGGNDHHDGGPPHGRRPTPTPTA
jgi:hypothetical protein